MDGFGEKVDGCFGWYRILCIIVTIYRDQSWKGNKEMGISIAEALDAGCLKPSFHPFLHSQPNTMQQSM